MNQLTGIEAINRTIATLNIIEVKGEQNIDMLLGCIRTLRAVSEAMQKQYDELNGVVEDEDAQNRIA